MVRKVMSNVMKRVKEKAMQDPNSGQRLILMKVARDIIKDTLLHEEVQQGMVMKDKDFDEIISALQPLSNKRRLNQWIKEARAPDGPQGDTLDSVLYLKNRCSHEFIHGIIFLGQLEDSSHRRMHIFQMSTMGACSGVDLVNKMRPGGELPKFWVCFDHVKRIKEWTTMAAHVYNPFVQELQTIVVCDFKVEDTNAQVAFWRMLNEVMKKKKFLPAEFAGFMADEAQANWLAIRTVFNGGLENIMCGRERSCLFHWKQSMIVHAKNCILPSLQEEHKVLCRKWRSATTKDSAKEISANRPKTRDGKPVRYRWSISKECKDKISRAKLMDATITKNAVLMEFEDDLFYIETNGSREKGVHYVVQISEYPQCSCLDFVERSSKSNCYAPCKHLYFVYICVLGLDPFSNMEINQKRRIHPHSSKSKSEKFTPPNEDTAVGFLIETPGTSQPFEEAHPKMTARHKSGIPTGSSRFKPVAAPGSKKMKNDEASTVPMQPVSKGLKSVTISDVSCEHGQRTATEFSNSSLGAASHLSRAEHSKDMGEAISNMESSGLKHNRFETTNKKSHHLSSSRADKMDRKVKEVFPKQGEFSKLHKIADSCYQIDVDNRRDVKMSSIEKHGLEQTERIYHSGPLIRSGYASMDIEELLKDHERKMQQAARRAAQEMS